MVQNKFGIPAVATRQLDVYTTAVLGATLTPPRPPRDPRWRDIMDALAARSCAEYRSVVYGNPAFAAYFAAATPQAELASLNIGSRPARRPPIAVGGGDADPSAPPAAPPPPPVTSLRAIPWIFAWTQTRLVLPAWLGVGAAVEALAADGHRDALRAMYAEWPFFASTIDLVEMILAKADMRIAALYDDVLVSDPEQRALGEDLRRRFYATARAVLDITGHARLCANNPTLRRLIETRNPYIDPCNIVQVELLRRLRADPDNGQLKDAVRLSIMSVSSGMRNTG
jgi:phosphoenolpyruvate carboxylase